MIKKVVIVGAGNVATHLGKAIKNAGFQILQIVSRTENSARALGSLLGVPFTSSEGELNKEADLYIYSVKDDAITEALRTFTPPTDALIVHTAGSVSMEILKDFSSNIGIFYPLQTFSKAKDVDFSQIPLYIEANNKDKENELLLFASTFSTRAKLVNSEQRYIWLQCLLATSQTTYIA